MDIEAYRTENLMLEILRDLAEASVKFVVCGVIAYVLHGIDRYTY